jgi:two-component system chemotaxis response regulator CheY
MPNARPAPKVLIVDDTMALRQVLRAFLNSEGCNVVGDLASGATVLEAVDRLLPDIVCLDYHLPGANGIELLKSIHASHGAKVSVVMITGDADPVLEAHAAEAGAAGFIRKPFSQDKIIKEIRQIADMQALLRIQTSKRPMPTAETALRAVIADDSAVMRMLLASILTSMGVQVVAQATDGKRAVAQAVKHMPELACLDIEMPVMNGLDALDKIRNQCPDTKVLVITARADRELVSQVASRGAHGYIIKPFNPERIVSVINGILPASSRAKTEAGAKA